MKVVLGTLLTLVLVGLVGGAVSIYAGFFDVAASVPHSAPVFAVLDYARVRSIKVHADGLRPPTGWDAQPGIVMAVGHYAQHCAVCHGAPGAKQGPIGEGMYPRPPSLTNVSKRYTPGELFWILKNGIKMSGMPSMADDGDGMLWSTVAFLQKLPSLSDDDYNDLWLASQSSGDAGGGQMDMGGMTRDRMAPMQPAVPAQSNTPKQ